ncbi:sporulation protein [Kurthia senegalensis]|uniref:sporulation protein n=1 Tax=Kurthia senegalensis TaxID=1033740 RepID=UPI00028912DF|nr:sporulation protein [Kurthia senegalensis]
MGFTTKITKEQLQVTTNVDQPEVAFGENLTGTVYVEGCEDEAAIDYIQLEVLIQNNQKQNVRLRNTTFKWSVI